MNRLLTLWVSLSLTASFLWPQETDGSASEEDPSLEPHHARFYLFSPIRHRNLSYRDPQGEWVDLRFYSSSLSGPYPFDASDDLIFRQDTRKNEPVEVLRFSPDITGAMDSLAIILPAAMDADSPRGAVLFLPPEVRAEGEVTLLNLTTRDLEAVHRSESFSLAALIPSEPKPIGRRGVSLRVEDEARQQTRIFIEAAPGQRLLVTLSPPFTPGTRELQVHTLFLPDLFTGND